MSRGTRHNLGTNGLAATSLAPPKRSGTPSWYCGLAELSAEWEAWGRKGELELGVLPENLPIYGSQLIVGG